MAENVIYTLAKRFAIRIINLYAFLKDEKHEHMISKQIYRSGTSIGANIAESMFARSEADYINKLTIALKEASETRYWMELLAESGLITSTQHDSLHEDLKTIMGTLINIINKLKAKGNRHE